MHKPIKFNWYVLGIILSANCSMAASTEDAFVKYLHDPQAPRVAVQICVPDKTAYFDDLTVDVTDLPADLSYQQLRELFQDANAHKAGEGFTNPYQSNSTERECQTIRLWRKPSNPDDYPQYRIVTALVANQKGSGSITGLVGETLLDNTEKDQPVFFGYSYKRPGDVIALSITLPRERDGNVEMRTFWFKLPQELEHGKYTVWMNAISEESAKQQPAKVYTGFLLLAGKEMPIYPVGENAPHLRYTLMSLSEYDKFTADGRRAMTSARLKHVLSDPLDKEYYHYVPTKHDTIPACGE